MRAEMNQTKSADTLALEALTFVASDETELSRFLGLSGLSLSDLRQRAGKPETLRAILEYVLGHEPTAKAFANAYDYRPADLAAAARTFGLDL